jgi:hypothetical protein
MTKCICFFRLFVCFELHKKFSSYLAAVTNTSDRIANLHLCLAFTASSSEGCFFTCHTNCDTRPPFLWSYYPEDPWFSLLNAVHLAKEQSLPILNVLGLTRPAQARLELTTSQMQSTTTRLPQPAVSYCKWQEVFFNKMLVDTWQKVSYLPYGIAGVLVNLVQFAVTYRHNCVYCETLVGVMSWLEIRHTSAGQSKRSTNYILKMFRF